MSLIRFNPWTQKRTIADLFDTFLNNPMPSGEEKNFATFNPVVDIYDNDTSFVINADLPGVKKEDITVDLHNGLLTIKAVRNYEKEVEEKNFYTKERAAGFFRRSFSMPDAVHPDAIKAEFKDGVLKIEIEKPEEVKTKQITVK